MWPGQQDAGVSTLGLTVTVWMDTSLERREYSVRVS